MDNLPPSLTEKARALAGLTLEERQELLAAAGALGLSSDHDPFWINQAFLTQMKTMLGAARAEWAETRQTAGAALAETLAVAKQLKPSADAYLQALENQDKSREANLHDKIAAAMKQAGQIELRRALDQLKPAKVSMLWAVAGIAIVAFVAGLVVGKAGLT